MATERRVPHLMGITLDASGVTYSQVVAMNKTTGDTLTKPTNGNKVVIFDAADFDSGYSANDVILFENVGASRGGTTITITDATGGFQDSTITCAAAGTTQRAI